MSATSQSYRDLFEGLDVQVPLLDGSQRAYINLDNAASTPAMLAVRQTVDDFLVYYSSVHRGTGFKSQLSTQAYEQARQTVLGFVGANPDEYVCIFGKNATEAANKLARRCLITPQRNVVLVSLMEHHSNDLPWRNVAEVVRVQVNPDGSLDEADFDRKLEKYASRLALVSISGASNVTGTINPIYRLAEKTHAAGVQIAVDCAQLAPHRQIHMGALDEQSHLDYVMLSGHKMYAPFGTGALIGRRDTFERGEPDLRGGGEIEIVTVNQVVWSEPPERDEAGSPNTVGAVALAAAIRQLEKVGMDNVARHEAELTEYTLAGLRKINGIRLYGNPDPASAARRLGVIPIEVDGLSHFLAAAILGYEFGIGVRHGCFCAHPYLLNLMGVSDAEAGRVRENMLQKDRRKVPGLVRISFGLYNETSEVDDLLEALKRILKGQYSGKYHQKKSSGEYWPEGWKINLSDYSFMRSIQ
jgi:selenocysteine lyase/cysteine desulfurase